MTGRRLWVVVGVVALLGALSLRLALSASRTHLMPSSNSSWARSSPLHSHSSGKYIRESRVTASSMSTCQARSTSWCLRTSFSVPQSPPPMISTLFAAGWVNSAGWLIIS